MSQAFEESRHFWKSLSASIALAFLEKELMVFYVSHNF